MQEMESVISMCTCVGGFGGGAATYAYTDTYIEPEVSCVASVGLAQAHPNYYYYYY